jgi:hypothetical protein
VSSEENQSSLSVQELEGDDWGDAPEDASRLVRTIHELRRKPIGSLTAEDLRLLIGQQVGLDVLLPRTTDWLQKEPLLEGDLYPGDVLVTVLRVPASYWASHPALMTKLNTALDAINFAEVELTRDLISKIRSLIDEFRSQD